MSSHTKQTQGKAAQAGNKAPTTAEPAKDTKSIRSAADAQRIPMWAMAWEDGLPPGLALQTKLVLNRPGDTYEQEADRVADQVMRAQAAPVQVQRRCACGGIAGPDGECEACKQKRLALQRRAISSSSSPSSSETAAPPVVHDVLQTPGRPLDGDTRSFMESRFGHDFGQVRIHTGTRAEESASAVSARAYTVGQHVVFGQGEYQPGTGSGQQLLAHELTHVVQQVPHLARDLSVAQPETCPTKHQEGEGQKTEVDEVIARKFRTKDFYIMWGTYQKGDTLQSFMDHIYQNWIRWRFGILPPDTKARILALLTNSTIVQGMPSFQPGCQYYVGFPLAQINQLVLIATRGKAAQEAGEREEKAGLPPSPEQRDAAAGHGQLPPVSPSQEKGATTTEQKGEEKPVPRTGSEFEGGTGEKANAPALPAKIDGPDRQAASGTGTYRMQLEYWPAGYDTLSQVVEAMNWVDYHWERYNITELIKQGMSQEKIKEERRQKAVSSEAEVGRFEGTKRRAESAVDDLAEDVKNSASDLAHPVAASTAGTAGDVLTKALANYENLELLPASAIVSLGGVALGALADLMGGDFQERELTWPGEGYYLIRCIAHPSPQGKQRRASSVATKIVEVQSTRRLATESLDEPEAIEAELKLQLLQEKDPERRKKIEQQLADQAILARGSALEILELRIRRKTEERDKATGERRKQLEDELGALNKQLGFAKEFHGLTGSEVRPRATFASRVTGETYPMLLQLGALPKAGSQFRCVVSDVSRPERVTYEGGGSTPSVAVWNAFRYFAGHNEYGRGTLVVRLPDAVDTLFGQDKVITPKEQPLDNVPRDTALVKQRLSDLVTILVILGLFVPGVGEVAAVIGAALAADHLYERWQRGTLSFDVQTVTDIIAILGAVGQGAALIGKLRVVRTANGVAAAAAGADEAALQKVLGEWAQAAKAMRTIELANKVINYGGLIWGDLVVVNQMMEINQLELNNKITHAEARRKRAELLASAIRDNALQLAQVVHRPAEAAPKEPATGSKGGKPAEPTTPKGGEGKPTELTKPQERHAGPGREQTERPGGDTIDPSRATPGQGGLGGEAPLTGQEKVRASASTPDGLHKIIILDDGRIIRCQTCAEIRAHYESFLGEETDTARKQNADEFKKRLGELEASTKATTDPDALHKLAQETAALDVNIRKFAAERLAKELNIGSKRTAGVEELLTKLTPEQLRDLAARLNAVSGERPDELLRFLAGREPQVIRKFLEALELTEGDAIAQKAIIEVLRRAGFKGLVKALPEALTELTAFLKQYQGRVLGEFAVRIIRAVGVDTAQARAEINLAKDILEGRTPFGRDVKVEGLEERSEEEERAPEYRLTMPDGTTQLAEVKRSKFKEESIDRNVRKAISQIIRGSQARGERGSLIRLEAEGPSTITKEQIIKTIIDRLNAPVPDPSDPSKEVRGIDFVEWVDVHYVDEAGVAQTLLLIRSGKGLKVP